MYINQTKDSPYLRKAQPMLFVPLLVMACLAQGSTELAWLRLGAMLTALGAIHWWVLAREQDPQVLRTMQKLHKDLRWFQMRPVTCHPFGDGEELRAALSKHGYQIVELDGTDITSWQSLGDALQPHTAPLRFPEEPRNHVRALLAQMAHDKPRRRAIVWRDALVAARHDPAFFARALADQASQALTMPAGLLLFVDLPEAAPQPKHEGDVEMRLPHREPCDIDRGVLAGAPDDAWWKPKPGEMTHG